MIDKYLDFFHFRLAVFDSLLVIDTIIQKSIIQYFTSTSPIDPSWYKSSFPYFWHPFKGIIRTVTIYMMVAISCDRFRAVCCPFRRKYVSQIFCNDIILLVVQLDIEIASFDQ